MELEPEDEHIHKTLDLFELPQLEPFTNTEVCFSIDSSQVNIMLCDSMKFYDLATMEYLIHNLSHIKIIGAIKTNIGEIISSETGLF